MAVDIDINGVTSNIVLGTPANEYTVTGDGAFDKLMAAFNAHIDAQYKLDRIKGADYANVYLAGMQSAMATALQLEIEAKKMKLSKIPSGRD